jgi:hypothetical protein
MVTIAHNKGIQVFPTVINDKQFTLLLNDQSAGNYRLLLTNAAGQELFQKMISHNGGNNVQPINFGNTVLPSGVYNLSVSGTNTTNQNFRLLIQ